MTPTGGAGTKVGLSDPVVESGIAIAQRIKATLGITGLSLPRVHIDGVVWHLDVGASHPGAVAGPKGCLLYTSNAGGVLNTCKSNEALYHDSFGMTVW